MTPRKYQDTRRGSESSEDRRERFPPVFLVLYFREIWRYGEYEKLEKITVFYNLVWVSSSSFRKLREDSGRSIREEIPELPFSDLRILEFVFLELPKIENEKITSLGASHGSHNISWSVIFLMLYLLKLLAVYFARRDV